MPFPEAKKVKYLKSPLENVICQLRFPPILKIDSQTPYDFQDRIREIFPNFIERIDVQQEFDGIINFGVSNPIVNPLSSVTQTKNYEFSTDNESCKINLTRNFISISTTGSEYSTWEDLISKFQLPLNALIEIYKPSIFSRVGLRYIDIFCRSMLGLEGVAWSELIRGQFLGMLGSDFGENVTEYSSICELLCEDRNTILRTVTNLVKKIGSDEQCFLMDCDVYSNRVSIGSQYEKLNYMHDRASRLLRYAITEKLHYSMEPVDI